MAPLSSSLWKDRVLRVLAPERGGEGRRYERDRHSCLSWAYETRPEDKKNKPKVV